MADLLLLKRDITIASIYKYFKLLFKRIDNVFLVIINRDFIRFLFVVIGLLIIVSDITDI